MRRKLLSLFVLLLAASNGAWGQGYFSSSPTIEFVGAVDGDGYGRQIKITRATPVPSNMQIRTYWWFDREEWNAPGSEVWFFTDWQADGEPSTNDHAYKVPSGTTSYTFNFPRDNSYGHTMYVRTVLYDNGWRESNTTVIWFNPNESLGQGPQLNGGIEVIDMIPAGSLNYGNGTVQYYNPKLRVYTNTSGLGDNIKNKLKLTLNYTTLDYGVDVDGTLHESESLKEEKTFSQLDNNGNIYYFDIEVPRSANYTLTVSATGAREYNTVPKAYYHNRYKITYATPAFDWYFIQYIRNKENNDPKIGEWNNWEWKSDGVWKWTIQGDDHITLNINSVKGAQAGTHEWYYNLRTTKHTNDNDDLELHMDRGIVKNSNGAWEYRGMLMKPGMGNEIPEIKYMANGDNNKITKYPPITINSSNMPEWYITLPSRAALNSVKVYTPVVPKYVPAHGLASFSSYYSLYSVDYDIFMLNKDKVRAYYTQDNAYKYGSNYYLKPGWYLQRHQGFLIAANEYQNTNIWERSQQTVWTDGLYVEYRILDGDQQANSYLHNELRPILLDGDFIVSNDVETENTGSTIIYGSDNQLVTGYPNMILHSGKFNENTCYNFFTMPSPTSQANMKNHTSYLRPRETQYKSFGGNQSIKIRIGEDEWDDDELVGIDDVRENPAEMERINNNAYYTLSGQKVDTPTRGLYIYNGKKVIVK